MPDLPPPDAALEELRAPVAALRSANARLREVIEAKDAQVAAMAGQVEALAARVAELERCGSRDYLARPQLCEPAPRRHRLNRLPALNEP